MGKLKAISAINYIQYIKERTSDAEFETIKGQLSDTAQQTLFGHVLMPMTFIDYDTVLQLMVSADKVIGKGDLKLIRDASHHNQKTNFNSIYRVLLPFFSPKFLVERASSLWGTYHDTGRLTAEVNGERALKVTLHDYPGIPRHHAPEVEGAFVSLLEMAKVRSVKIIHTKCASRNDPVCEWAITWGDR